MAAVVLRLGVIGILQACLAEWLLGNGDARGLGDTFFLDIDDHGALTLHGLEFLLKLKEPFSIFVHRRFFDRLRNDLLCLSFSEFKCTFLGKGFFFGFFGHCTFLG